MTNAASVLRVCICARRCGVSVSAENMTTGLAPSKTTGTPMRKSARARASISITFGAKLIVASSKFISGSCRSLLQSETIWPQATRLREAVLAQWHQKVHVSKATKGVSHDAGENNFAD
jgi:hypothetical protein